VTVDSQKTWKKGKKRFSLDPLVSSGKYHIGQTGYGYVKKVEDKEWKSSIVKKGRSEKITSGSTKRCRRKEKNCPCLKNGIAANWLP
jgi:hypothetical protein